MAQQGTLSVVATPIGNLEDMTLRAIRVFKEADYILCEDTRVTGKLLKAYDIKTPLKRYDAHSSLQLQDEVCADLEAGKQIALCSDAGTPGVSDSGVHLVALIYERSIDVLVVSVPGPSSVTAAFSIAGIAGNQFCFLGFVPQKKGRLTFFKELEESKLPVIFLESTHRIMKTFQSLQTYCPDKTIVVAREMTKMHEEVVRGRASELVTYFNEHVDHQKGEFVLLVH